MRKYFFALALLFTALTSWAQNTEAQNLTLINAARADNVTSVSALKARTGSALDALNYSKQGIIQPYTASGTDTYTVTGPAAITAYAAGQTVFVTFTNANTGAATLNMSSIGAVDIRDESGSALTAGLIPAGSTKLLRHNGSHWRIIGGSGGGGGGGGSTEVYNFADIAAMLASSSMSDYNLALVSDGSSEGYLGWVLYQYLGTSAASISNYIVISSQHGKAGAVTITGSSTINFADGDVQVVTSADATVEIDDIDNPIVDKTITLIFDGSNTDVTFDTGLLDATINGAYNAGEENLIFIQCLQVSGTPKYIIAFVNSVSGFVESLSGDGVDNTDPANPVIDLIDDAVVDGVTTKGPSQNSVNDLVATKVSSVSGTSNRISVSGTTTPVVDIDAAYVGQASITTLGTVATGTWNATAIGVTKGGTGLTALGTASQMLRVNSGATALEYFTPSFYSSAGNAFGANSTLGLTDNFNLTLQTGSGNIIINTNAGEAARINSTQDWLFGGGTLTTATRYDFRGSGSSTTLFRIANSTNQAAIRVQGVNGEILFGTQSNNYIGAGNQGSQSISGAGLVYRASQSGGHHFLIGGSNMGANSQIDETTTAGAMLAVSSTSGFWHRLRPSFTNLTTQTSVAYDFFSVRPSINNTGGSTVLKGHDYAPSVTSSTGTTHYAYNHDAGFVAWNSVLSPAQITSNQNDYNPTGWNEGGAPHGASILRLSSDASRNVTSLTGGVSGRLAIITNVGAQDIVLKDDDGATGTAANRFEFNADITLQASESIMLFYDGTSSRWRALRF
jgi:hypothetical protein